MGPLDHPVATKSANGLKYGPEFEDFPVQIPENAEKRPIFDGSF